MFIMQVLQEVSFGLTRETVGAVVMEFLQKASRPHPFKQQPGYDWWAGFLQRWPILTERRPQHLSRKRAEGANYETIHAFFERVEKLLSEAGIHYAPDLADRLWNCDESGLCNAVVSGRILARKGSKWVHDTAGGSGRSYTTIHGCGSASGIRLPPFIVYKGKHLYTTWTKGGAAGAMYAVSESGWMEKENYESWFKKMFLPAVKHLTESGPVVLFFDGHHSHISVRLIELSRGSNVHLMLLPSNTTHVLQPLDVGVYGPLKQAWKNILGQYKMETRAATIGKEEIPKLVAQLWDRSFKPQHLQGGFRETGLFPVNSAAIPSWKLAPALPLQSSTPTRQRPQTVPETPLRTELRKCFLDAIKPTEAAKRPQRRKQVHTIHQGEALTSDEVLERIREEEEEKRKKAEEKKKSKKTTQRKGKGKKRDAQGTDTDAIVQDESHCQICGDEFQDGEEEACVGCDECWRWVHYYCAGLDDTPDEDTPWLCSTCSSD